EHTGNRVLNMKEGILERNFTAKLPSGKIVKVSASRFCSIVDDEAGAIRYAITPMNFSGELSVSAYLDADVENEDANYDHKFWDEVEQHADAEMAFVIVDTKKTQFDAPVFRVCTGMTFSATHAGEAIDLHAKPLVREKYAACTFELPLTDQEETVIYKYAANLSSENHDHADLLSNCKKVVSAIAEKGFEQMKSEQAAAWAKKWENSDIVIEGDVAAQQGIRFNIFHLNQTYTGEDPRLNIGPKGFTGEKYGGSTYWDTEAYCLPFYLATAEQRVARNLLVYRYRHLQKAIENAAKLGFTDGAALYPMVTITGEECHNEWEITFEEIHRNGAIAFAIYDYIRYTGDQQYLQEYGLEVLVGIARFWSQRVHFSTMRNQFVMLGVTGPNEYENNVNNNWYTSYIAVWCLNYCMEALDYVKQNFPERFEAITEKIKFYEYTETKRWKEIAGNMFLPEEKDLGIFLQQDTYMDKELLVVDDLRPEDRPLNQNWSWDRILRSCFIKQADVLQGLFLFEGDF
ncbi:MAG: glycoside hydrolase family 65 protein, partial [Bacteroidota bacterium]